MLHILLSVYVHLQHPPPQSSGCQSPLYARAVSARSNYCREESEPGRTCKMDVCMRAQTCLAYWEEVWGFLFVLLFCVVVVYIFGLVFFKIITWVVTNSECLIKSWVAELGSAALLTFSTSSARYLCLSWRGNCGVKTNRRHPPEAHADAIFQER